MQIPAFRVKQFETCFYIASLPKDMLDKLVRFEVMDGAQPVMEALAKKKKHKGINIDWKEAIKKINFSKDAYQRPVIGDKIVKLAGYYDKCKQGGDIPPIPGSVMLVSKRELEYTAESDRKDYVGNLSIPVEEGLFTILDGQHRTFALSLYQNEKDDKLEVPVIIFDKLNEQQRVELYVTINFYLTKLRRDQIWQLKPRLLYTDEFDILTHQCIEKMNNVGPLAGKIKMLGVGKGIVSQSALAGELRDVLEDLNRSHRKIFSGLRPALPKWIADYFQIISEIFAIAWNHPKEYSLDTAIALRSFINVIPDVVWTMSIKVKGHSRESIRKTIKCWENIGDDFFRTTGAQWMRIGKGTRDSIRHVSKELKSELKSYWKTP